MDWLLTRLNILADGLEKKEQALGEIVNITENQSTVIQSGLSETETQAFIVQMNREKQQFINQVLQCDNMFEQILKEAGPALDAAPENYRLQVLDLQTRIRRVMDLDVKIRVYEEKNNALLKERETSVREPSPDAAQKINASPVTANPAPPPASQKPAAIQPNANRIISAYAKNTRNYRGGEN